MVIANSILTITVTALSHVHLLPFILAVAFGLNDASRNRAGSDFLGGKPTGTTHQSLTETRSVDFHLMLYLPSSYFYMVSAYTLIILRFSRFTQAFSTRQLLFFRHDVLLGRSYVEP